MKIKTTLIKDINSWNKLEKIVFPSIVLFISIISLYLNDSKIALLSSLCGIFYTIFAGKGNIVCYAFGILANLCYSYISFKNSFYGNFCLNFFYYLPMQILGILKWKQNLKPQSCEIKKTKLSMKEFLSYFALAITLSTILSFLFEFTNNKHPIFDAITTIFSIFGMLFTVKRCIEQWYIWLIVNFCSIIMWTKAYIEGSNCFATILMWSIYFCLTFYFYIIWKKEIKSY